MKRYFIIIALYILGLTLAAACTAENTPVVAEPEAQATPTAVIKDDGLNLSQVGSTGRPQFVYAFAKW